MSTATLDRPTTDRPDLLDEAAFRRAWHDLRPHIVGYLHTRLPADAAEDVTQDTFLRAWNARHTYRPDRGSVQAWIYAIAGRLVADHYRTAARRPQVAGDIGPEAEVANEPDVAEFACTLADNAQVMCRVRHALATLPVRQQQVVVARYLCDLPIAEVAIRLRVPHKPGTVKSLASRGLTALRAALAALPAVLSGQPPALPTIPDAPADPARAALASLPTLESSRSAHACPDRRPARRRGVIRHRRPVAACPAGLVDGTSAAPRAAAPPGPGNLPGRHCGCRPDPGSPRVEAAGPAGGNPHRLGSARQGAAGPGTPHPPGHHRASTAGRVVTGMAAAVGMAVAGTASAVAAFAALVRGSARGRRDTDRALAAVDRRHRDRERLWSWWRNLWPTQPAIGTATPAAPGVELEHTVRLAPQPWAQPIPQAVLNHVRLRQDDRRQAGNTGRHWRAEP